jgi:dihydrofolate synthase/folylpolyglutamate synthase
VTSAGLSYLYSLTNEYRSIRYDLRNMQALAAALRNPERTFRSILIAGTNGKGSVAKLLSAMMPDAGLYTSPHLVRLNERIQIGNSEICDDDLEKVFATVMHAASTAKDLLYPPTYFEMVTAMAFLYFRDRVKIAILEVGLGGRLDATNIVDQDVSVITSIGLDHQKFLGTTIDEIAAEKAGIIKSREPVIIGPSADLAPIRERAGNRLMRGVDLGEYPGLHPKLLGRHQVENISVAIRVAECIGISIEDIVRGVNTAVWPGRLERFGRFLLDGAHNIPATNALAAFLAENHPDKVWIIFGVMADKDFREMIGILEPHARKFIFTKPKSSRALDPAELRALVRGSYVETSIASAIEHARRNAPPDATILICGSLYLIGEARAVLIPVSDV